MEIAGATPAVDAILPLCLSSHRTSFVNSNSSVRVRPEAPAFACWLRLGGPFHGDHDVRAASRPVKAFVPVRIRLVTPIFDGTIVAGYRSKPKGWLLTVSEPPDASLVLRVRFPLAKPRICGATCLSRFSDEPQSLGYRQKPFSGQAGSNPARPGNRLTAQLAFCPSLILSGRKSSVI